MGGGEILVEVLRDCTERFRRHPRAPLQIAAHYLDGQNAKRHRRNEHEQKHDFALCYAHIGKERQRADNLHGLANHFGGERKQNRLDCLRVGCKAHKEVTRSVLVEERKRIVLNLRKQILLDSAQNVERDIAHKIAAQIARYRADNKDHRDEHSHAQDIPETVNRAVFGHKDALENLVENHGHTETARRAERQARKQRPDQIPNLGSYIF